MKGNRSTLWIGGAVAVLTATCCGQKAPNWRGFKQADGLPESSCLSVAVAPKGKVLVRHLNPQTISELDGYSIRVYPAPAGATSGRVYESPGGQLWAIHPNGLQEFKQDAWMLHPLPEIAGVLQGGPARFNNPLPLTLCPLRQGVVVLLLPSQLLEFNSEDPDHPATTVLRSVEKTHLQRFSSMSLARDGGVWIAGAAGLCKAPGPLRNLKPDSPWREYLPPPALALHDFLEPFEDDENGVTCVAEAMTNRHRVVASFDGHDWQARSVGGTRLRLAWKGADGTTWAASIGSLFQCKSDQAGFTEDEEISARQYFDAATEPGGVFWLATSDGLFRRTPLAWRTPAAARPAAGLVHCLAGDANGRLWFIANGALNLLDNDRLQSFPLPREEGDTLQSAQNIFPLKNGTVLLEGDERLILFRLDAASFGPWQAPSQLARYKPLGWLSNGRVCLQSFLSAASDHGRGADYMLETFDGLELQPLDCALPGPASGTNLASVYEAQNGDLWLSSERGTACYHEKAWRTFSSADRTAPQSALTFAEMPDGRILCATREAVWQFDGRVWLDVWRGFDRINGLLRTRDGSVWVASDGGLYRLSQDTWVENGLEEGLPGAGARSICEDIRGRLWVGTRHGVASYYPETDRDPPHTQIVQTPDNLKSLREGATLVLNFSGLDRWKQTPSERLLYSWRLDEREWSAFQEIPRATFTELVAGKHYFQVRAMDRNCNVDLDPAHIEFAVVQPWYKEARLVLVMSAGLGAVLFFAGLALNRHRQLLRSYAQVEQKVAERTHELELASRELLHSQKMNALGTLAAGIAHDFNNILSIVKGSAQIIEEHLDDPQKVRTRLDRIKTVVEQGAGIVRAMLGFSRDGGQQPGSCDLNGIVEDTITLLGDRFLREVQVRFDPARDLPAVVCSRQLVQQALLNFIFNAAEASPKGGQIELSTRRSQRNPAITATPVLMAGAAEDYVSVSVRDHGCGIPPENLGRIFEPFFTTKALSARRGTGLGLSMVYELAKKMDAGLVVESAVGEGSTFTLILPVREERGD